MKVEFVKYDDWVEVLLDGVLLFAGHSLTSLDMADIVKKVAPTAEVSWRYDESTD